MRYVRFLAAIALAPIAARAYAQQPASPFAPIEFVVGSCWVGTFPEGKQTDEHCFEWVFDRKFVRDRHVVRGGELYQGETLYDWDAKNKRLAFTYWNSLGMVMHGDVKSTPQSIVFDQGDGRSTWTRTGPDGYHTLVEQKSGDGWKTLWAMDFTRKR